MTLLLPSIQASIGGNAGIGTPAPIEGADPAYLRRSHPATGDGRGIHYRRRLRIEMGRIGHLPVAVHRALQEKALRDERDRAQNGLRHSEALYRALAVNLSYGICRCDLDGKFLEVNEAMVKMLGYASKEELLAVNLASGLIQDAGKRAQLLGSQTSKDQSTLLK